MLLKIIALQFPFLAERKKDWLQNFVLLWALPKRTSKSKTKTFPFCRAERGKSFQNQPFARVARRMRREAPLTNAPKI